MKWTPAQHEAYFAKETWKPIPSYHGWYVYAGMPGEVVFAVPKTFTKKYIEAQGLHPHTHTQTDGPYTALRPEIKDMVPPVQAAYLYYLLVEFVHTIENNESPWNLLYPEYKIDS